ncbi:MAG: TetR/AcrR family transcriptional regulator [Thermomicrobiales bacterium]
MSDGARASRLLQTPAVPRRSSAKRDDLAARLLHLFQREGFLSFSVGDLCERLRCSKRTLYAIAPSREQLNRIVVETFYERLLSSISTAVSIEPIVEHRLAALLAEAGRQVQAASMNFFIDVFSYPPTSELQRSATSKMLAIVERLIEEGMNAGVYRAIDPRLTARAIAMLISSAELGELDEPADTRAPSRTFSAVADLLLNGLLVEGR